MKCFWASSIVLLVAIHLISASTYEEATDDGDESTGYFTLRVPTISENFPSFDDVLSFGYYQKSCPQLESIINKKVREWIKNDYTLAASLLRLHFHDIGRSSCGSIQHRLFNFSGTGKPDPSLDKKYLSFLRRKCRWASDYVDLDASTPSDFDPQYFKNLEKKMGLLSTDQLLYSDPRTSPIVSTLIYQPSVFYHQFGASMTKLGNVQVLTGQNEGEIRTNCNFVNSY